MRKYLVISFVIAIAIMPLMYSLYTIFYVAPFVETHFPTENYDPFFQTWYGVTTIVVWIAIGSSWVIIQVLKSTNIRGIALLTIVLLLTTIFSINVSATSWKPNWNNGDPNLTEGIFHRLPEGKPVTVTAQPHRGFVFDYWVIDGSQQEENPANLLMDQNHTVEAHFIKKLTKRSSSHSGRAGGAGGDPPVFYYV